MQKTIISIAFVTICSFTHPQKLVARMSADEGRPLGSVDRVRFIGHALHSVLGVSDFLGDFWF